MRRSGGLGSVLPADAVPAAYVDVSLLVGMVASGEAPSSAAVADRASFASCTTYDELGRLRHAWTGAVGCTDTLTTVGSQPGGYNTSWTYTDDGNIATRRDGAATTTYDYADTAHPHAVTGASGATYAYTAGGNQRTRTSGTTTTTLTWDVLSRLTKAVTAVGGATTNTRTYVEDVDGTRLERTDGTTTTRYVPGQEIDYTSGVVSAARRYYAIAGTTVAVRVVTPATSATVGVLTLQVSDRQGSATLQVTDRTGAVARAYTDPYGAPRPSTTALVTDRGWLQKTKDTTGLVDLGARYYDPALGRFLSPDPLNVQVTAQSANAYAYGNNNPVTYTDPTGLEPFFHSDGTWSDHGITYGTPHPVDPYERRTQYGDLRDPNLNSHLWEQAAGRHADEPMHSWRATWALTGPLTFGQYLESRSRDIDVSALGHGMLDLLGLIPFFGEVADLANAAWYAHDGDAVNAALSTASAVPALGWMATAGKYAGKAGKAAKAEAGAVRACEGGLCGIPGKTCFVAGTLIRTERGDIPIEQVKVGDKVWSRNIDTGKDELQPVVQTYVRHADTLLKLTVASAVLTTTADHPFMVKDRGWVKAGDLTVGDVLVTPTGTAALVGVEWVAKGATVYNFQVAVNHDYYALAGVTPILVHNANYDLGELLTSGHGAQRLAERGFDDIDIAIVRSSSTVYEQADGAVAHVARLGDTYNVVVVGERGLVTGMKGVTEQGLGNLARNYGWTGFP